VFIDIHININHNKRIMPPHYWHFIMITNKYHLFYFGFYDNIKRQNVTLYHNSTITHRHIIVTGTTIKLQIPFRNLHRISKHSSSYPNVKLCCFIYLHVHTQCGNVWDLCPKALSVYVIGLFSAVLPSTPVPTCKNVHHEHSV
jgi:hypothetical protein